MHLQSYKFRAPSVRRPRPYDAKKFEYKLFVPMNLYLAKRISRKYLPVRIL